MLNWLFYFIFYSTVLWCIPSSYTILWYLNFSSAFHLLQDYVTLKVTLFFSKKLIAELYICICNLIYVYRNRHWAAKITPELLSLGRKVICVFELCVSIYSFFSTAYTQNYYLSHNFWKLTLKQQKHTPNLQIHTLIISLWLSFQFHKHFLQNTTRNSLCNTHKSNRN